MKAQSKWYKGYLKQGSLSKVASKIHLTTFLHHFFSLSNSCFSFLHNQFFLSFQTFFLLVNYKSNEIDPNIMLTSMGRWPLFRVIKKKFWFFIGSKWVTKEDHFFLDKERSHIISTHDCFTFKSFNPKVKKKSITLDVAPCLPLLFLYYFLFFLLS